LKKDKNKSKQTNNTKQNLKMITPKRKEQRKKKVKTKNFKKTIPNKTEGKKTLWLFPSSIAIKEITVPVLRMKQTLSQ